MIKSRLKTFLRQILSSHWINYTFRTLIKPIQTSIPLHILARLPVTGQVDIQIPGLRPFRIDSANLPEAANLYWDPLNGYEPGSIQVILRILESSKTVFDIGAHRGLYTLIVASHPHITGVHAFEPNPQTFQYLSLNVEANAFQHVSLQQAAVSDQDGTLTLYNPENNSTALDASTLKGFRPNQTGTSVASTTISTYVREHHLEVDFMKIDTEATEPDVLRGGEAVIDTQRPMMMCEVLAKHTENDLTQFFKGKNYLFYQIVPAGLVYMEQIIGDRNYQNLNYLFVPSEKNQLITSLIVAPGI